MAGVSHRIPTLIFAASGHFSSSPLHPIPQSIHLYPNRTQKHFTLCATSARKPRAGRKIMEDEELCDDLREFMALHRFPEGQVPSMKELSTHGRRDLANIVRRRGYKAVGELLKKSMEMKAEELTMEENLVQQVETTEASSDIPPGQGENVHDGIGTLPMAGEVASVRIQDVMSSMSSSSVPAVNSNLQETVVNFIHNEDLDISEDELQTVDGIDGKEDECTKSESETVSFSACPSPKEDVENGSDELNISCPNGRMTLKPSNELPLQHELSDTNLLQAEISTSIEDLDIEIRGTENKDDIKNLKFELHQKELELFKLKEQIEKEKLALSNLQSKAEAEITKAWNLVAEKDAELSVIEEHLSGLKEVQIQYRGEGTTVEVAGSFNGWHLRIKMEPESSSSLLDSGGSRKPRLWSTTLWLYPGVYEVKFIVDGQWRVDPHTESITKGAIHNNILRVES